MATPVALVDADPETSLQGAPVTIAANGYGTPMTVVSDRGAPVQIVSSGGAPVVLLNPDGTPYVA